MAVDYSYYYFAPGAEAEAEASSTSSATSTTPASSSSATDSEPQPVLQKLPALANLQSSMFIDLDSDEWDDNLGRWIAGSRRVASAKAKLQSSATPAVGDGELKK